MIFHTIYTMSINRYSLMDATGDIGYTGRIKLPVFVCGKAYKKLQAEIGVMFNDHIFENDVLRSIIYNRITMYQAALLVLSFEPDNKEMNEWYMTTFNTPVDMKRLKMELERLRYRYKELKKDDKPDNRTFEELISGVETALNYSINRSIKLYAFKSLYDLALKKVERSK